MCSSSGNHAVVAICLHNALFASLGADRSKTQGGSTSTVTASCKGGKEIIGGGCQQTTVALGKVRYAKPLATSWSCGYTTTASHLADRYCVNANTP